MLSKIIQVIANQWLGILLVSLFVLGFLIGKYWIEKSLAQKIKSYEDKEAELEKRKEQIIKRAEQQAEQIIKRAEKEIDKRMAFLKQMEENLIKKEWRLEKKEELLEAEKAKVEVLQRDLEELKTKEIEKLSEITDMDINQAKELLLQKVEEQYQQDILSYINKLKEDLTQNAKQVAADTISKALPKVAPEYVGEFTAIMVDLPNEEMKWKIIGREGRNISFFEKVLGVEILIDDTPQVVKVVSHDPQKRFVAQKVLEKLIKSWRINPVYIEETYNKVMEEFEDFVFEKWKEALSILGLPKMHPELTKMIGKMFFRYSYGQNLWQHSIEVAQLSAAIASELGLDANLAKKAGLFHDIGKIAENSHEGHTRIGADILRKFKLDEVIVNTAEGHHFDVPLTSPIGYVVVAADGISASRPGARFDTREIFIERMRELENLVNTTAWVKKSHIMQAWREIMVFVDPQEVSDLELEKTAQEIGQKIEEQLEFPGIIRVVVIRESKVTSYVR